MKKIKKTTFIAVVAVLVCISMVVSAALLTYYGRVNTEATVYQSVRLDGLSYYESDNWAVVEESFETVGGCCESVYHDLENFGCIEASVYIDSTMEEGIDVDVYEWCGYTYEYTFPQGLHVLVEEDGDWLVWTYTFAETPTHTPKMSVAIDYPNGFAITTFDDGSHDGWYYSPDPYDPLTTVKFAEYSGGTYEDWVETVVDGNVMTVKILKSELGNSFEWHGFGNYNGQGVWLNPTETGSWDASLYQVNFWCLLSNPFTLDAGEKIDIMIQYCFDIAIVPDVYEIVVEFQPATI